MTISPEYGSRSYDTIVADVEAATERLLATAQRLTDAEIGAPSALPGWTRGHVLTHLARNADALDNLLTWAATGVETPMYASYEARDEDIEAGSDRGAAVQLGDLQEASDRFGRAAAELSPDRLDQTVRMRGGAEIPAREIPGKRLVELELHHVDLDAGYTPAHWPDEFVTETLAATARRLGGHDGWPALILHADDTGGTYSVGPRASATLDVSGPQSALLAWLSGRSSGDGLRHERDLPPLPAWG